MSDYQEVPHVCSLQVLVLHEIAKKQWEGRRFFDRKSGARQLIKWRKQIINDLPRKLPIGFPKLLRDKLIDAVINIQLSYKEAIRWQSSNCLPFSIFHPDAGRYEASNFIKPFEHFDYSTLVKLFVSDENQPIKSRFVVACDYGFEEMIPNLWDVIKAKYPVFCDGNNLEEVKDEFGEYAEMWVYNIEERSHEIGDFYGDASYDFYGYGFSKAVWNQEEYPARFFWKHCWNNDVSESFRWAINYFHDDNVGFYLFLYSQLSLKQKIDLLSAPLMHHRVLACLLSTNFRKSIVNDILYNFDSIPFKFFSHILYAFIDYISAPAHNETFKALWNRMTEEQQIHLLKTLALHLRLITEDFEIELFGTTILPLPFAVKEEMLLGNWVNAGHKMVHKFIELQDYDNLLCYFLLFFLEYNSVNHKLTLRTDPLCLVHSFISCDFHVRFMKDFKYLAEEIDQVMEHFRETLPVIDQLLKQAEKEATIYAAVNYHDFLSNNIYPLLSVKEKVAYNHKTKHARYD